MFPLADYGLVGDTRTAALTAPDGSVDWLCLPRFDSEPVFGRLVGGEAAGAFQLVAAGHAATERRYRDRSAVLETELAGPGGRARLTEGFVMAPPDTLRPANLLVRRLDCVAGEVEARLVFRPRRGPGHREPRRSDRAEGHVFQWGGLALGLTTSPPVRLDADGSATVRLAAGRSLTVALSAVEHAPLVHVAATRAWSALAATDAWWRSWCDRLRLAGPRPDAVLRSLLTLRLLAYAPSGAPVASPTTSLPEELGGERNWDYRYSWPRDASIGVDAFLSAGAVDEAAGYFYWLIHASRLSRSGLPPVLTVHGRRLPPERVLPGWPGYAGSPPVRVGNAACGQHQLDVYGWVLDAAWRFESSGHRLYADSARAMARYADVVARRWGEPDAGIWESRETPRHYVHSKLMAWLALDRALRLAQSHRVGDRRTRRWTAARSEVAGWIRRHGWDDGLGSYVRTPGRPTFDGALLVLPWLGIEPPGSSRVVRTVHAVRRALSAGDDLLYRYDRAAEGRPGVEGAFLPCSFWLVAALARIGEVDEATALFEQLCDRGGALGLLPEEVEPGTGAFLGNHPLAFTHATLVQAALALEEAGAGVSAGAAGGRAPRRTRGARPA